MNEIKFAQLAEKLKDKILFPRLMQQAKEVLENVKLPIIKNNKNENNCNK